MVDEKIHMTGIVVPAEGKADRLEELLLQHAEFSRKNEPGTIHYEVQRGEERGSEGVRFVVWEVYKDEASRAAHFETEAFHKLIKAFQEEGLAVGAPKAYITKPKGGVTNWP
ncbi:hypothetical protein SEUCBS139899_004943 [Sporothrix eucalyptigena]